MPHDREPLPHDPNGSPVQVTEVFDDDMHFVPAESGSAGEDEEGDLSYHGQ